MGTIIFKREFTVYSFYRDIQNAAGAGNSDAEYERLKLRLQDAQQKLEKVLSEKSDVGQHGPHKTGKTYATASLEFLDCTLLVEIIITLSTVD